MMITMKRFFLILSAMIAGGISIVSTYGVQSTKATRLVN
jgi:hypothetical protein